MIGETSDLEYCHDCKKNCCLDCVKLVESDDCKANRVKYYVYCPVDRKHQMNSTWLQYTPDDKINS